MQALATVQNTVAHNRSDLRAASERSVLRPIAAALCRAVIVAGAELHLRSCRTRNLFRSLSLCIKVLTKCFFAFSAWYVPGASLGLAWDTSHVDVHVWIFHYL